jgi:hypothetical protein
MIAEREWAYHVRALSNDSHASLDEVFRLRFGDFILGRAWERDVDNRDKAPWAFAYTTPSVTFNPKIAIVLTSMVCVALRLSQRFESATLELQLCDLLDELLSVTLLGDKGTLGVGEGEDGSTQLDDFECGELGDVA